MDRLAERVARRFRAKANVNAEVRTWVAELHTALLEYKASVRGLKKDCILFLRNTKQKLDEMANKLDDAENLFIERVDPKEEFLSEGVFINWAQDQLDGTVQEIVENFGLSGDISDAEDDLRSTVKEIEDRSSHQARN